MDDAMKLEPHSSEASLLNWTEGVAATSTSLEIDQADGTNPRLRLLHEQNICPTKFPAHATRRSFVFLAALSQFMPPWCESTQQAAASEITTRWAYEVTSGPFQIHADFELTSQSELINELNQLSGDVTKLLEISHPKAGVHIVIFGSPQEYRRYMGHYYPDLPQRRALFIQQRGTGMLFAHRHEDLPTDLRHETVHALLNQSTSPLPLWLDEGLAEYFEVPAPQRWSGHAHLLELRRSLAASQCNLEQLESLKDVGDMASEDYRDAWAWVHFLLHRRSSTRKLLLEQLQTVRSGRPTPPLSRIVAVALPNWRKEFVDHFRRLS